MSRRLVIRLLALATAITLIGAGAPASAAPPDCAASSLYVVAHEDDSILFQSPTLLSEVEAGDCIRTIFTTAGDAGRSAEYWEGREAGAKAAYANMAEEPDVWNSGELEANGHTVVASTLAADPRITLLFMRLPDGGYPDSSGSEPAKNGSLMELWNYGHPPDTPAIASLTTIDGKEVYSYTDFLDTLVALIDEFEPTLIATQNYLAGAGSKDHPDHIATAKFTRAAQAHYGPAHQLIGYVDYETLSMPQNVFGVPLLAKQAAFYAYGAHDEETCSSETECQESNTGRLYETWLRRQYVAGTESTPGADAGQDQIVIAGSEVGLNGSGSFDPGGDALSYAWTQTAGPPVTLSDPAAAEPTFTAPNHGAALGFSLITSNSTASSLPSEVTVEVAVPPQVTSASETIFSTGEENSFEIVASGEPAPSLSLTGDLPDGVSFLDNGDGTATLSGTPSGPAASYPVTLEASNAGGSDTQQFTVEVAVPPQITSAGEATFSTGEENSFEIVASGEPAPSLSLTGDLPDGVSFLDNGDGTATLSGTPSGPAASYPVTLEASNAGGSDTQELTISVTEPPAPPDQSNDSASSGPQLSAPVFTTAERIRGTVRKRLRAILTASGSPIPTIIAGGSLPPGLRLKAPEPGWAILSGRPRRAGTYSVELRAEGAAGTTRQVLTVVIDRPPALAKRRVEIPSGQRSRRVVRVSGWPRPTVRCRGPLPTGIKCRSTGAGNLLIANDGRFDGRGTYRPRVVARNRAGIIRHALFLRVDGR